MDFDLTEEQRILKTSARSLMAKACPMTVVRELKETEEGYSTEIWRQMAGLGWMGVVFPETYGGIEGSFLDLIVLMEEMGYAVCPSPFLPTVVLGGLSILTAGSDVQKKEHLPLIARGERIVSPAFTDPDTHYDIVLPTVNASEDKGDYVIHATKLFVPYAQICDAFLCLARTKEARKGEEGLTLFLVDAKSPGIRLTPLKTLEKDKQFEVVFEHVRVPQSDVLGILDQAGPVVEETLGKAAVARAAEMVGGAQAAMDMAMQYARERIQFDRPIGSFQAVQRHFANMWMDIQSARFLIYKAAWKISEGIPAGVDSAMAKYHAGRGCRRVTTLGHQIFGAISFTMEHDMHLYYRQAIGGDLAFGNSDFHGRMVGREVCLSESPPLSPLNPGT
jgi:alkylation response protein AidB-like acyl-CoA dehydrogenase